MDSSSVLREVFEILKNDTGDLWNSAKTYMYIVSIFLLETSHNS